MHASPASAPRHSCPTLIRPPVSRLPTLSLAQQGGWWPVLTFALWF